MAYSLFTPGGLCLPLLGARDWSAPGALAPLRTCANRAFHSPGHLAMSRLTSLSSFHPPVAARNRGRGACALRTGAARSTIVAAAAAVDAADPQVVLTREAGKNGELLAALEARGVRCLELPLVEAVGGPDRTTLPVVLSEQAFDYVVLTSPESAAVFIEGWRAAGKPKVRLATVGPGTSRVLLAAPEAEQLAPVFEPSKANAEHFGPELPWVEGGSGAVLYPASVKASTELQDGLTKRGFSVTRLNTYSTMPVEEVDASLLAAASRARVVTFAAPSAVRAWMHLCQQAGISPKGPAVSCIGSTSARAADGAGLAPVFYPDAPGIEGWVDSTMEALGAGVAA